MRVLILVALFGLVAQSVADAPKPVYVSPVQEYAAPVQEYAPAAEPHQDYSVQTVQEEYAPAQEEEYEEVEEAEDNEEHSGGILTGFFSNMLSGAPIDAIASLLGVTGLDNLLHDNKITVVGSHGKPIVIPLPFGKHHHGKGKLVKVAKLGKLGKLGKLKTKKLIHKKVIIAKILTKLVLNVVGFALLFFVVAGVGATVCAFTPLCSITLPAAREMRSLATTANLNMLSSFVSDAIHKYQNLQ